uniref:Replication factor A C-terminal domain-containing protein n=1 Tax=Brassica campestris TaxID=3711 RepID=A0A3P5Z613_BRACM|nr:unnamed protein product [Brassica rapa]
MAPKPNGKSPITSESDDNVMFFRDVSPGPHETQLRFRLIHFWEAWNPLKKTLIGIEMLLIDEQTVPSILMKTDSNFIPLRISKLAAIAKETSTSFIGTPVLDEVETARARHVLVHVQSHELVLMIFCSGPVMKLFDQAAKEFCKKFKSYENTPTVLLVTTVNTKSLGGALALTSMSSSHVFMDYDVQPTIDYFGWLGSNPQSAEEVNAEVITKQETLTIGEIFSYIKQGSTKCTATIDYVVHGSAWYRAQISVYDNSEQAVFVLLGDAGFELTGKHASELVSNYFEANGNQGVTQEVPVPKALLSTIGQKHNFCVKVTKHNLDGKSRSLTVTKILPLWTLHQSLKLEEGNNNTATGGNISRLETRVCGASKHSVDSAEGSKRTNDIDEMGKAKRLKCGK